jgi:hypothetical protein
MNVRQSRSTHPRRRQEIGKTTSSPFRARFVQGDVDGTEGQRIGPVAQNHVLAAGEESAPERERL